MKILNADKSLTFETTGGKKFRNAKLVVVEWRDSATHSSRWDRVDDIVDENGEVGTCLSCGWILRNDKTSLVIIPHIAEIVNIHGGIDGASGITIPREAVVQLTYLFPARKGK
jgi:hypothetical protein